MKILWTASWLALGCLLFTGCNADVEQIASAGGPDNEAVANSKTTAAGNSNGGSSSDSSSGPQAKPISNKIERIGWDDLNCGLNPGTVVRDWMVSERAKELDGQRVKIQGVMLEVGSPKVKEFVLLKNAECKFGGPEGQADHLIEVELNEGVTTKQSKDILEVTGKLKLELFIGEDGTTWSMYRLAGEKVTFKRR